MLSDEESDFNFFVDLRFVSCREGDFIIPRLQYKRLLQHAEEPDFIQAQPKFADPRSNAKIQTARRHRCGL